MENQLDRIERRLTAVETCLSRIDSRLTAIESRLKHLPGTNGAWLFAGLLASYAAAILAVVALRVTH